MVISFALSFYLEFFFFHSHDSFFANMSYYAQMNAWLNYTLGNKKSLYEFVWFKSSLTLIESCHALQWHSYVSFVLLQILITAWNIKIKISHRYHWPALVSWFYLTLCSSPVMRILFYSLHFCFFRKRVSLKIIFLLHLN